VPYAGSPPDRETDARMSGQRPKPLGRRPKKRLFIARDLLVRYMRHVGDLGGACHTDSLADSPVPFTKYEIEALRIMEHESDLLDLGGVFGD
jgi:hypothetical protein